MHHFESFNARIGTYADVTRRMLCLSEQLRAVPLLLIGSERASTNIVLTCRHHACESTANYVAEGIIEWVLAHPDSRLRMQSRFMSFRSLILMALNMAIKAKTACRMTITGTIKGREIIDTVRPGLAASRE